MKRGAQPLVIVWLAALAMVALLAVVPVWLLEDAARRERPAIIVIGSSLMAYGVPLIEQPRPVPTSKSLLGDGRGHSLRAIAGISEPQFLGHLDRALLQKPALVLLEINPLLFDFAHRANQRPCDGWPYWLRHKVAGWQQRVVDAYRGLRGKPPRLTYNFEPGNIATEYSIDPADIERTHPLTVRAPCDMPRLAAAVARARAQDTQIVFILPPRSPEATRLLGPALTKAIEASADDLAASLSVPLFKPQENWPNSEFVDAAHMNLRGRAHFLAELRRWWASAQ